MNKRTLVSIYQVDSAGVTGAHVGEGSLVDPRLVLVHPPLSEAIASGHGPTRCRMAIIRSGTGDIPLVEIIDGWEQPRVLGESKSGGSLVGLELRSASTSLIEEMDALRGAQTKEELVDLAIRTLEANSTTGPTPARSSNWWGHVVESLFSK